MFLLWPEHCPLNAHCGTLFTLSDENSVHLMGWHHLVQSLGGMETETVQHITCCCEAMARQRYNYLWEADCRTKRHKHSLSKGPSPFHTRRRVIEAVLNDVLGAAQ